jgi:hypothetical protein
MCVRGGRWVKGGASCKQLEKCPLIFQLGEWDDEIR